MRHIYCIPLLYTKYRIYNNRVWQDSLLRRKQWRAHAHRRSLFTFDTIHGRYTHARIYKKKEALVLVYCAHTLCRRAAAGAEPSNRRPTFRIVSSLPSTPRLVEFQF